jgi:hypothetical protein
MGTRDTGARGRVKPIILRYNQIPMRRKRSKRFLLRREKSRRKR